MTARLKEAEFPCCAHEKNLAVRALERFLHAEQWHIEQKHSEQPEQKPEVAEQEAAVCAR